MRLIGMLDSPYVRRVAVSLNMLGIPFENSPLSVFRDYDELAAINPVVKAPTLVLDDGTVLIDSTLILEYVDRIAPGLTPDRLDEYARSQRILGLALTAAEKAVQLAYEDNLRPAEKRHEPWVDRVTGQLVAALGLLDAECAARDGWLFGDRAMQADITAAVAWRFAREKRPGPADPAAYPALAALSARAEALPAFLAAPFGL